MKTTFKTIILVATIATGLYSCKKGDTGGDVTLAAHVKHHETHCLVLK